MNLRFLPHHKRIQRETKCQVRSGFIQRDTHSTGRVWAISEGERPRNMAWLAFMGWVISQANEWEDYSNYFGEGADISRTWATAHFLAFYGQPQNCHGAGRCVTQLMLMYYNGHMIRLKVHWKSDILPSWTQSVLTSFCHVLWLCHSLKGCALPPSLLFQDEKSRGQKE